MADVIRDVLTKMEGKRVVSKCVNFQHLALTVGLCNIVEDGSLTLESLLPHYRLPC